MELKQCFSNMKLFGVFFAIIGAIFNFGSCDTVCDFDRVGPQCQFKNIAYGKDSRFDSNTYPPRYSYLANDNNRSSCSYTSDRNIAAPWWNIWLPEYTAFKKLEFVTEESHLSHFPDFEVTVYNTTESNFLRKGPVTGGLVCYNHNNSVPQSTKIQVTCNGSPVGNLIRLQLHSKRFQLVLCDLRLYGDCYNVFYGNDCQKCSDNCQSSRHRYCDSKSGHCFQGCKPGWKGDRCETECDDGKWGSNCTYDCGKCDKFVCNRANGVCEQGCAPGFKSQRCTEKCDNGSYDKECKNRCSSNCLRARVNTICDNVDGTCLNGCKAGYRGSRCDIKCDDGKWGINCTNDCGKCLTSPCNHVNGHCQDGCAVSYKKTRDCHTECDTWTFGKECKIRCSNNCFDVCDKKTGVCSDCKTGWKGERCTIECNPGRWGKQCRDVCGKCVGAEPCDRFNGTCVHGCLPGFKRTLTCEDECEDGTYGNSCQYNCSHTCKGICNKINGTCDQCRQFWTGHFCEKVSDKILSDIEALTRYQETIKPNIVLVCVGIFCVILVVYATVITVLFKRKTTQNEKDGTGGSLSGRTQDDAYVNETNKTELVTYEPATEATTELARVNINAIDDESHQYTDLSPDTKDVEATYETIQLE